MQSIIDEYNRLFSFRMRIGKYIKIEDWLLCCMAVAVGLSIEIYIGYKICKFMIIDDIILVLIGMFFCFIIPMLDVILVAYFFLKPKVKEIIRAKHSCNDIDELDNKCRDEFIIWLKGKKIEIANTEQMNQVINSLDELMKEKRPKIIIESGVFLGLIIIPFSRYIEYIYANTIHNGQEALNFFVSVSIILGGIYIIFKCMVFELNALSLWINGGEYRKLKEVKKAIEVLRIIGMNNEN